MSSEIEKIKRERLAADGSDRQFFKGELRGRRVVVIEPSPGPVGLSEASSYVKIGRHLFQAGIPVPEIFLFYERSGVVVVEDCGDLHLHKAVKDLLSKGDRAGVAAIYRQVLAILVDMQLRGAVSFDTAWCYDTARYNSGFAFEREALYFFEYFLKKWLGISSGLKDVYDDLFSLSQKIDEIAITGYFLHRDFQSRNILLSNKGPRIIDFQAGRLGPLGYDVSSLILDPYVELPWDMREELLMFYGTLLMRKGIVESQYDFMAQFNLLGLMRSLQVLGAFSYLQLVKGKDFFGKFMKSAFSNVYNLITLEEFEALVSLRSLVIQIKELGLDAHYH